MNGWKECMNVGPLPRATYRLQFNKDFSFKEALAIKEYLSHLGISHCYASPLLMAKPGSTHGYDVVDYNKLNPEIGTEKEFEDLIQALKQNSLGLILDIVPNHMYINHPRNQWWQDVLENGPSSPYADYFDIDWHPPRLLFDNKIFLPVLDQPYEKALENQTLKISYSKGAFYLVLYDFSLPTDPKSWPSLLNIFAQQVQKIFSEKDRDYLELASVITALNHLPAAHETNHELVTERLREKEIIKKRLEMLIQGNSNLALLLHKHLDAVNGKKGDPLSFDLLEKFLDQQSYRLCYWRVANDEINYRRFFDIFEYAGIRTEKPEVFDSIHQLIFTFIEKGFIQGLRIDHIDGLYDPYEYLTKIYKNQNDKFLYVVAEKILTGTEKLPNIWPLNGTVGYDYLNLLNGLFVHSANKQALLDVYQQFTNNRISIRDLMYVCKKLVIDTLLSSEVHVLAKKLDHIAQHHRSSKDFTAASLKAALCDIIACFPVYRSYVRAAEGEIREEDRLVIRSAVKKAKRSNPVIHSEIYQFIQSILLLEYPDQLTQDLKTERQEFVMRFQQLTGPVMAKGIEDTAFYRYYPLSSLNEVGSDLYSFGTPLDTFHKANLERLEFWPHSLLASSTHDTKRGEDVRARLNVLSEIPQEWAAALKHWSQLNEKHKVTLEDEIVPDPNEEYLLYQTIVGTWPLEVMDASTHKIYISRIQKYMEKAVKEAKIHSSWLNPDQEHDQALSQYIDRILENRSENVFLQELKKFTPSISTWGLLNSLSQTLLKLTSPGIPDIYQGNEIWDFSLVDPDNRRPVDYHKRQSLLQAISETTNIEELLTQPQDGRMKLFLIHKILQFRKTQPQLFDEGIYVPLKVQGSLNAHVIAYARVHQSQIAMIITTRFYSTLMKDFHDPKREDLWKDTYLELPVEFSDCRFINLLNQESIAAEKSHIRLDPLLKKFPMALLEGSYA